MKSKLLFLFVLAIFMTSCSQKEMKISRSDYSVETEIDDFSPAYILKNDEGETELLQNSLIGNTNWVLSVERDLTLSEVAPFLQELTEKKFQKDGVHEDTKDIYFVYSDTLHQQNAYVKLPFKSVFAEPRGMMEPTEYFFQLIDLITDEVSGLKDFKQRFAEAVENRESYEGIIIDFSDKMTVEEFVNILIEFERLNISDKIVERTFIY
ncbi:MAG TPA: hypothetical protein VKY32_03810 [Flavobacterium sp.]|nr:hypothetical protein [Flavobacterium sp.]